MTVSPTRRTSPARPPTEVQDQIAVSVAADAGAETVRLGRGVAVRVLATLALTSYALWTLSEPAEEINTYVYAAVAAVAGLLATSATVRIPQLVAADTARRLLLETPSAPTPRQHRVSVAASVAMWVLPLVVATGNAWAGLGLVVALLPLVSFVSSAVLATYLAQWSKLPAQIAVSMQRAAGRAAGLDFLDDEDAEADAALDVTG